MNAILSIATVATAPRASREATMPPAISIWLSTQPPKIWPLVLMSRAAGATRSTGSRWPDIWVESSGPSVGLGSVMASIWLGDGGSSSGQMGWDGGSEMTIAAILDGPRPETVTVDASDTVGAAVA